MPVTEMISPAAIQEEVNASTRDILSFVESNKVEVVDLPSLARAHAIRKLIGEKQKSVTQQLARPKQWAFGLHQWFCSLEKAALAPLAILDGYEREQIRAFDEQQTRERQARERAIAEARRLADQERATAEAAALERAGEHQMAAAVVAEAIQAAPPVVVLENEVRAVQSFRRTWHFEITDAAEVPRDFCAVDETKLQRYATAMKDTAQVPGVRFYWVDTPVR